MFGTVSKWVCAGSFAYLTSVSPAPAASSARTLDYPETGVTLGNGWNSATEEKAPGMCITFSEEKPIYQSQFLKLDELIDTSSLTRALDISASFKIKAIGGGGEGGAKFAHNVTIDSSSTSVAVRADVINGPRFVAPPDSQLVSTAPFAAWLSGALDSFDVNQFFTSSKKIDLTPDMASLVRENFEEFRRTCGDSFVSTFIEGASLTAVLSFTNTSVTERNTIAASVAGNGLGWSGGGALAADMTRFEQENRLGILFSRGGGSGDPLPTSRDELLQAVKALPTSAVTAPKPFKIVVQTYDTLPSWPSGPLKFEFGEAEKVAQHWYKLRHLRSALDDMLMSRDKYVMRYDVSDRALADAQDMILEDMQSLELMVSSCASGTRCRFSEVKLNKPTDYDYRVYLPYSTNFVWSPPWGPWAAIIYAQNRYSALINIPARTRCQFFEDCVSNRKLEKYWREIYTRIQDTLDPQQRVTYEALSLVPGKMTVELP